MAQFVSNHTRRATGLPCIENPGPWYTLHTLISMCDGLGMARAERAEIPTVNLRPRKNKQLQQIIKRASLTLRCRDFVIAVFL